MDSSKKYDPKKKKYCYYLMKLIHMLNHLITQIEDSTLWNFLLIFILSIYQSGCLWSLLHMRYVSALLEPTTPFTRASLALGDNVLHIFPHFARACVWSASATYETSRLNRRKTQELTARKYALLVTLPIEISVIVSKSKPEIE